MLHGPRPAHAHGTNGARSPAVARSASAAAFAHGFSPRSRAITAARDVERQPELELALRCAGKDWILVSRRGGSDDHLVRASEHFSRVRVRDGGSRLVIRDPSTRGDPFG